MIIAVYVLKVYISKKHCGRLGIHLESSLTHPHAYIMNVP